MATWIVGDIHGWHEVFERLLARLDFDWRRDRLWLTGDLVNRGPDSLAMLRRARELEHQLGDRFAAVLGNHDLHLLAHAAGLGKKSPPDDLLPVLQSADRDELLGWLERRPLAHADEGVLMVHAGLWPDWTTEGALEAAARVGEALRDPARRVPLLRGPEPAAGEDARALYGLTSLRVCKADGRHCHHKGTPAEAPPGCLPWFAVPERRSRGELVVFGHWAALGLHIGPDAIGLDSGCSWGNFLSALRLEDRVIVEEPNPGGRRRG